MNYYETIAQSAQPVDVEQGETSYFSTPNEGLDQRLFRSGNLLPAVREAVLTLLENHLALGYSEPSAWATAYLAGSGVSYQWSAHREPADLDCLVSVNYVQFRQSNQEYKGWSDKEIASEINQGFRNELHPRTDNFMSAYELTFYVNVNPNITEINPYAAYSVTDDTWVVPPTKEQAHVRPEWDSAVERDRAMATEIVKRYAIALDQVKNARNDAMRINAETHLANAVHQGTALFDDIHTSRSSAFNPGGQGYNDYSNYRWQSGKQTGVIQAMKKLKQVSSEASARFSKETYGMTLPDAATLLRRAYRP